MPIRRPFGLRYVISLIAVLVMSPLSACGVAEPPHPPGPMEVVNVQLSWFHSTGFIGYYVAQERGYYNAENLDVTLIEGGPEINTLETLAKQEADFVVLSAAQHRNLLLDQQAVVALMAPFQISPRVFFSLVEADIQRPHDLVGRKVGITSQGWRNRIYQTLEKININTNAIIEVEISPEQVQRGALLLEEGVADVLTGFVNDEVVKAQMEGYDLNSIFPADYDVGLYTGLLVSDQNTVDTRPDMIERFMRATLRGWQFAVECNKEAAKMMLNWEAENSLVGWNEKQRLTYYEQSILAMVPLIDTGQVPIGWIDEQRWQREMGDAYRLGPGYTAAHVKSASDIRCQ